MTDLFKQLLDGTTTCEGMPSNNETVTHLVSEHIWGDLHSSGIESLPSTMKRAYKKTLHRLSARHLARRLRELAARHNHDTTNFLAAVSEGGDGKRLRYKILIAGNGLLGTALP
ncbi:MAG: hypothetical protein OXH76_04410 [Boseongicola sp.]|nr:hypothetical protein [Boseongicola sp.]